MQDNSNSNQTVQTNQADTQQQTNTQNVQQQSTQQQTAQEQYISIPNKELGIASSSVNSETLISPSEPELVIHDELAAVGVEKAAQSEISKLTAEVQKLGASHAKESVPVITLPSGTVHLPHSYQKALQIEKQTNIEDSSHWYAALILYLWKKLDPAYVKRANSERKAA